MSSGGASYFFPKCIQEETGNIIADYPFLCNKLDCPPEYVKYEYKDGRCCCIGPI